MAHPSESESARELSQQLAAYPNLRTRIFRQLLIELHSRGVVSVDQIYEQARAACPIEPEEDSSSRLGETETEATNRLIEGYSVGHLTPEQIRNVVTLALKREEADALSAILNLSAVSFRVLADKIRRFCSLPAGAPALEPGEAIGLRVGLIRHIISDQLEFIGVAKYYLTVRDFDEIVRRIIGPEHGIGRIGGKAAGMLLAYKVLTTSEAPERVEAAHRRRPRPKYEPLPIAVPESFYLRSDVMDEFLELNGLGEYQNQKYKSAEEIRAEYPLITRAFRKGKFPATIVERLRQMLVAVGNHPLIVRSSSLLEDRFGTAFSGKYSSFFIANQGRLDQRLKELLRAIAEVYASALGPDPLLYRRANNLMDYPEDVGVLIQKVVGTTVGNYLLPAFAGVAFSRNEYRWSPRIRREDGLVRLVMGLGTRAVERVGNEYPRMVALTEPTLRPESSVREIMRNSQRTVDAINLAANRFESVPIDTLLAGDHPIPMLDQIVSIARDDALYPPAGRVFHAMPREMYVTFDKLLRESDFPQMMREMLRRLEDAYEHPVDVEFAHDGERLYMLQCRVQTELAQQRIKVPIPTEIPADQIVFTAKRYVRSGVVDDVEYVVLVRSEAYEGLRTREARVSVGRAIGAINDRLADRTFVLIGPGRWGSNDILLGVPVTYADICHARLLIEVARERDGYVPEVSFGTHFFQDLVEARIHYLPLYPDERGVHWNVELLERGPNQLVDLLPQHREMEDVVRVIHVPSATGGRMMRVVMDGDADEAVAYLVSG
ncbi:MAG: PEP/pyruvate-binding domain-containing protein [Phycisphaerae bacterium]|nr:PEP/pyruvate-binding domain-containing protein [Phycisphaerae bacterium]